MNVTQKSTLINSNTAAHMSSDQTWTQTGRTGWNKQSQENEKQALALIPNTHAKHNSPVNTKWKMLKESKENTERRL